MKNNIMKLAFVGVSILAFTGCSDEFLQDKKNYDNIDTSVYDDYDGALSRVNDIYSWCLPDDADANWKYNCTGNADDQSKSTEEYAGFGLFVNPDVELSVISGTVPDYFHNQANNIQASVWGRIRNINDCIEGILAGSLSDEQKNVLVGQVYFFRAWCYYQLVKWYGGVPIIKEVQEISEDSYTPRSSAKECIEFIVSDLDKSAELLKNATFSESSYGRITASAALALKGRVLVLWCSPLFNRANDQSRWQEAYNTMKTDFETISANHALYMGTNNVNASAFAGVFTTVGNTEMVFATLYNNISDAEDGGKNNNWENSIRPRNTLGGGGLTPSKNIIDLFPMADGGVPTTSDTYTKLTKSAIAYNEERPFLNRDPRFYRTFAFPGVRWAFSGSPSTTVSDDPCSDGKTYELWNYVWYTEAADTADATKGGYAADNLLTNNRGMYVRKRTDDLDINSTPLYSYLGTEGSGFKKSGAPIIEIRYAEVLLNMAEAACGAGQPSEAVQYLQQVRERAGYTAANNYGLSANLSDQAACMSAILYERQIEFAYEGKRFDDLRRWLLFDGGANMQEIAGCPSTWTLTGWNGNTCDYLGFKPINGQRRDLVEFRTTGEYAVSGKTVKDDPLVNAGVERCAAIDLSKDNLDEQLEELNAWYDKYLVYKKKKGDAYDQSQLEEYMHFFAKYYFLGFTQGAMNNDVQIEQTIGWEDTNNGGANGTFDPLN
ncbi:MAG: RagB/SusD family nutrient uptake outer membrane protein [Bacteroidales bacterium]|jgi:hypothetical protein|nr:RagB/SusD family nutrient uptake outer membrane protein [Bacteroidales bacterium]